MQEESRLESTLVLLVEKYIREDKENILGFYLVPFTVGDKQKVELVIATQSEEHQMSLVTENVDGMEIISTAKRWRKAKDTTESGVEERRKINKDLKNSIIIYDPDHILVERKARVIDNKDLPFYYNSLKINVGNIEEIMKKQKESSKKGHSRGKRKKKNIVVNDGSIH